MYAGFFFFPTKKQTKKGVSQPSIWVAQSVPHFTLCYPLFTGPPGKRGRKGNPGEYLYITHTFVHIYSLKTT